MSSIRVLLALASIGIGGPAAGSTAPPGADRIQLTLDSSEAEAVLAIVDSARAGRAIADPDWRRLFATEPYTRLKRREAGMHREFTDDHFKRFVLSPDLAQRADSLRQTLGAWRRTDLTASARRVLAYLPDSARIRTRVLPVIKPLTN